jgi:hypothetical protein
MKSARITLFLQLCLLASVVAAATPEQEMDAEAKKLFPTLFNKCGEDYFSNMEIAPAACADVPK